MSNLAARTLSGLIFVAVCVIATLYGAVTFVVLFAIFSAICVWEFCTLVSRRRGIQVNRLITTVAAVYLYLAVMAFVTGATGVAVFAPYVFTIVYLLVSELYLHRSSPVDDWAFALAAQLYVALPFAVLGVLAFRGDPYTGRVAYDYALPLALLTFLWLNDMGAYCFGSLLSRYVPLRLFPSISPHKSWIGSIGGALLTLASSLVFAHFFTGMGVASWLGMAAVVVVFGTWGDLVESQLKRSLGVKDSGAFLPGHGGALDRFDSFLLASPCVVLYFYVVEML